MFVPLVYFDVQKEVLVFDVNDVFFIQNSYGLFLFCVKHKTNANNTLIR